MQEMQSKGNMRVGPHLFQQLLNRVNQRARGPRVGGAPTTTSSSRTGSTVLAAVFEGDENKQCVVRMLAHASLDNVTEFVAHSCNTELRSQLVDEREPLVGRQSHITQLLAHRVSSRVREPQVAHLESW